MQIDDAPLANRFSGQDLERYRAYDRLNAVADILTICVVMFFSYFLTTPLFNQVAIYSLSVLMAIFSLIWHTFIPARFIGPTRLLVKHLVDTLFVSLFVQYTGDVASPFFFLYYLILLAVAVSVGLRSTILVAGVMAIAYAVMTGVGFVRLLSEPQTFIVVWANLVSIGLVAYLAAFLSDEADKARRSVVEAKDKVEIYSKVDWLTGLYNMRYFDSIAAQELARAERYSRPLALLMVDADHLKVVNDTYGHARGDHLICEIARVISEQARTSDTVVRYGGDEFIVILPETDSMSGRYVGERIRQAAELLNIVEEGKGIETTVSIGVASYPSDGHDSVALLARADAALYFSKHAGRNRVTVYEEGIENTLGDLTGEFPAATPLVLQAVDAKTPPEEPTTVSSE